MIKVITSLALVALLSSSVLAAPTQSQGTQLALCNAINLLQGSQAANAIQNLAVSNDQQMAPLASQSLLANIAEIANASGECAAVGVVQNLEAAGTQTQTVFGPSGAKEEGQSLGFLSQQGIAKSGGLGAGDALHQIVLTQGQSATNYAGVLGGSSAVLGLQSSGLTGSALATGVMESTMGVSTVQGQASL